MGGVLKCLSSRTGGHTGTCKSKSPIVFTPTTWLLGTHTHSNTPHSQSQSIFYYSKPYLALSNDRYLITMISTISLISPLEHPLVSLRTSYL